MTDRILRVPTKGTGYAFKSEDRQYIKDHAVAIPKMTYSAPEEIDPRPFLKVENQGSMGSCRGHSGSTTAEYSYYMQTGEPLQLSRLFMYLGTQKIDGISGDRGSTISGGLKLLQESGICKESTLPYPNPVSYSAGLSAFNKKREECYKEAALLKMGSYSICKNYDDVFTYLSAGLGIVDIGISWGGLRIQNDVGVSFSGGGGGHAIVFGGYTKNKDQQGRNLLLLGNSWGESWQGDGWIEVLPSAVDQMCRHQYTVMIGMSDMTTPEPRHISWVGKGKSIWS